MFFSAKMQNLTFLQGSSTNKTVILSDRYDQEETG